MCHLHIQWLKLSETWLDQSENVNKPDHVDIPVVLIIKALYMLKRICNKTFDICPLKYNFCIVKYVALIKVCECFFIVLTDLLVDAYKHNNM